MYSSAAHISLRQGCRSSVPLSDASFPTVLELQPSGREASYLSDESYVYLIV